MKSPRSKAFFHHPYRNLHGFTVSPLAAKTHVARQLQNFAQVDGAVGKHLAKHRKKKWMSRSNMDNGYIENIV